MSARRPEGDLDQAITIPVTEVRRPWLGSRRRARRLGPVLVISLWLHLTLLLFMLVTVKFERQAEEELPPPSEVAMVFEGGTPKGPALPNPKPNVAAPSQQAAPPPAPPAPASPPPPLPAPAPPALRPPPPVAVAPPPPSPPAETAPEPLPTPPLPPPPAATAEIPLPKPVPPLAMVVPRPPSPARPAAPAAPKAPPAPPRPSEFPTPMNFSFGRAVPQERAPTRTSPHAPNTLDFSLAPRQGATDNSPFSRVAGARVGPDWRNLLSAWVRAHAYYPEQAAMNGEDGDAMVQVVANPSGHVTSVEMRMRSGSQWLDMALIALFRDADLPPLMGESEPITFNFTMHYILIRMQ